MSKKLFIIALAIVGVSACAERLFFDNKIAFAASDYYVSAAGSDANSGTASAPWRTIQHAASLGQPGWVIHVAPGTYKETIYSNKSGAPGAWITFVSDTRWGAKIDFGGSAGYGWNNYGDYVRITGFDMTNLGMGANGTCDAGHVAVITWASVTEIDHNRIHDLGNAAGCVAAVIDVNGAGTPGISPSNDVHDNVIFNITYGTTDHHGGYGIYHQNFGKIYNNLIYRVSGFGIHLWHGVDNIQVYNNTVYDSQDSCIILGGGDSGYVAGARPTFYVGNNILANCNGYGIRAYMYPGSYISSASVFANNLVYNAVAGAYGGFTAYCYPNNCSATNALSGNPLFVSAGSDFHLQSGSPAVNKGMATNAPPKDLDDVLRPQGGAYDVGAYEYSGGAACSAPSIASPLAANGTAGLPFSYQITATNGPSGYGASGLPSGVSVNTAAGLILGTPTAAGTYNIALAAANSCGTGSATLVLVVSSTPPVPPTPGTPVVVSISPTSGPTAGGTPLVISGFNFLNGAAVTIGGAAATGVTFIDNTKLTALTPAHVAGLAGVWVVNPGGQYGNLLNSYNYAATGSPSLSLSPTSLAFGNQTVGVPSVPMAVALFNAGSAPLALVSLVFGGSDPREFSEINNCTASIPAGGGCIINVAYKPIAPGASSANLSIAYNAPGSPSVVSLTGNAITGSATFAIGDRVQVNAGASTLTVRAAPTISGTNLGSEITGFQGTVIGGPVSANGYNWWQMDYDVSPDGWSVENYLAKAPAPPSGLVGWWKLDEASGANTFADVSGKGNNGTCLGATCPTAGVVGRFGRAANFDGINDRITIGDPANGALDFGTSSFTYSLWVYVASNTGTWDIAWFKGGTNASHVGYDMELGTGPWTANLQDGVRTVSGSFGKETLNQWVMLTAVVDRSVGALQLYRNAALAQSINLGSLGSLSSVLPAVIGNNDSNIPFKGKIDNVRIFNRAITAAEVGGMYNGTF